MQSGQIWSNILSFALQLIRINYYQFIIKYHLAYLVHKSGRKTATITLSLSHTNLVST